MKINSITTQNFKGYDACPLKRLYMQGISDEGQKNIYKELKEISEKEGFDVSYYDGSGHILHDDKPRSPKDVHRWIQDDKTFILKNGKKEIISAHERSSYNRDFSRLQNLKFNPSKFYVKGGNIFIGKDFKGKKWALVGVYEDAVDYLEEFCTEYDIKPRDVHFLPQPNFHLDMAIRPIGYPFVLVNDERLVKEKVKNNDYLKKEVDEYYEKFDRTHPGSPIPYANCDEMVQKLKKAGFIPIRIAGVFTEYANYMNAIVNEHPDGTISYITNSTKGTNREEFDKIFKEEFELKAPGLKNIYFVSGGEANKNTQLNPMMRNLDILQGGIHCMTLEEPDFERWG